MMDFWKPTNNTDGFNPITKQQIMRQYLQSGDMTTALVQFAMADTNRNGIFDTAEEYKKFTKNMENALDTSYKEIDYSFKKPSISYDF
jgi:hypothetical protein